MYCRKCGNEIKDGEKFCGKCGQEVNEEIKNTSSNKKKNNVWTTITVIIAVIVAIAVIQIGSAISNKQAQDYGEQYARNLIK